MYQCKEIMKNRHHMLKIIITLFNAFLELAHPRGSPTTPFSWFRLLPFHSIDF
jgi:hypothetical protein